MPIGPCLTFTRISPEMAGNHKTVCIVGGGIAGLVCAQTIQHLARSAGCSMNLILLEKTSRLGGQIKTKNFQFNGRGIIIEEGAEGFVTRSEVFPRVAAMAGLHPHCVVDQIRIADNELGYDTENNKWRVHELPPGVAAQKLGFQVPDRDRGRGIRSFRLGMVQIVDAIGRNLTDVRLNSDVVSVHKKGDDWRVGFRSTDGESSELQADAVVLGIPAANIQQVMRIPREHKAPPQLQHNSHVSVHLLVPRKSSVPEPSSFTVPIDLQDHFHGLRAVALVNEKFPQRCPDDSWLFRFYYRPNPHDDLKDSGRWISSAKETLREVYGFDSVDCSWFSPWSRALPVISKDYLESCGVWKEEINRLTGGRVAFVGSETTGAGLEAAALSGFDAGSDIFNRLTV